MSPPHVRLAEAAAGLDPKRLVFIDETSVSTTIARLYGWAPQGERLGPKLPTATGKPYLIDSLRH